jgi:hypothetical protein
MSFIFNEISFSEMIAYAAIKITKEHPLSG